MTQALATTGGNAFSSEYVALIQRHVMQSVDRAPSPEEFQLFLATCQRTGLDPLMRQIYCIERKQNKNGQWISKYETQISIDGARLVAERTGRYEGQVGPLWCGADAVWYDVWPFTEAPVASKVGIWKAGFREPLWAVAHYAEYVQTTKDGNPTKFWRSMPALMLAKCAESLALRKAFPNDLSGLYTREEMAQADTHTEASYSPPQPLLDAATKPASNEAMEELARLRADLEWTKPQLAQYIRAEGFDPARLNEREAGRLIDWLTIKAGEHQSMKAAKPQPLLSDEYDAIDPPTTNGHIAAIAK